MPLPSHGTNDSNYLSALVRRRVPHEAMISNLSTMIRTAYDKTIISESPMKPQTLGFIRQVKAFAEKCGKPMVPKSEKIDYIKRFDCEPGIHHNMVEIDINHAYWKIALDKGYINEEIYFKGIDTSRVDKTDRLVALGSIATVKRHYGFDGEVYESEDDIVNELTRSYFFDIANELGRIMCEVIEECVDWLFVFFWVDAVFCVKGAEQPVIEAMARRGFKCKTVDLPCLKVEPENDKGVIRAWATVREERRMSYTKIKIKPYQFPTPNRNKSIINRSLQIAKELGD